jgi:hypothetical protein
MRCERATRDANANTPRHPLGRRRRGGARSPRRRASPTRRPSPTPPPPQLLRIPVVAAELVAKKKHPCPPTPPNRCVFSLWPLKSMPWSGGTYSPGRRGPSVRLPPSRSPAFCIKLARQIKALRASIGLAEPARPADVAQPPTAAPDDGLGAGPALIDAPLRDGDPAAVKGGCPAGDARQQEYAAFKSQLIQLTTEE